MVFNDVQNKEIVNFIIDNLKLNPLTDQIPKAVIPTIQPVFEVNKRIISVVKNQASTSTGNVTAFTTPTDKDFYLKNFVASYYKDSSCNLATGTLDVVATIDNIAIGLGSFAVLTLTEQGQTASVSFPTAIKIDRGSAIYLSGAFTLGAMSRVLNIKGYFV